MLASLNDSAGTCGARGSDPHDLNMREETVWRRFIDSPVTEWTIFFVGVILMIISPVVGAVPGPGGVFVFALGLAMVLKTSRWARRHYVRFKRWQPEAGRWTDWGLRRKSALRREAIRKQQNSTGPPSSDNRPEVDVNN